MPYLIAAPGLTLTSNQMPRRGEIWTANLGSPPVRHWVLVVSLDERNLSDRRDSVLIVPLSSSGPEGATVIQLPPGETGLPGPSFVKGHFIQTLSKRSLLARERRILYGTRMREVTLAIRRGFDPDAPWPGQQPSFGDTRRK
jgi:mRNA-degrading endonuclease toxin of MazEF toxin-antitoxin module